MRILHVCQDAGVPVFGRKGGSTHIRELCRTWLAQGHDVRLVCAAHGDDRDAVLDARIIAVSPASSKIAGADLRRMLTNRRFARALPRAAREWRPELIYERHSLYTGAAQAFARRLGVPLMLEVNALLSHEQGQRLHFPGWAARRERRAFVRADHLVVVSEAIRQAVLAMGVAPERITLQPISVDVERFTPRPRDPAKRAEWGWSGEHLVAGYLGALTSWHAPGLFLEAAAKLAAIHPMMRLLCVGGAAQHVEALRAQAREHGMADRVVFLGSVPHGEVPRLLAEFDVGVLPGVHEWATPTKLFEYGAMGIPIVAPRTPNIEAVLRDGETARLFAPGSAEDLAQALGALLADAGLRRSLGDAGRQEVLAKHSWSRHAARLAGIGQELAARGPERG